MTLRLGIVGAGGAAALHAQAAAAAGLRVTGVCDVDAKRASVLASKYPGARATGTLETLLERRDVDAVVVAVPNVHHKDVAIAALRAGKDVLLEKPMAMSAAECDEIIAARVATGRILQVGFVCRGAPAAEAAAKLIAKGRLGRIYHAKASLYRARGIPGLGRWFTTRALSGGGALMDLGVHLIDLVLHLTGHPRALRASAVCSANFGLPVDRYAFESMWAGPPDPRGVFDVEDAASALVRFEGGLSMELNVTWAADVSRQALRDGVVLLGDRGGCMVDLWNNQVVLTVEQGGKMIDEAQALPDGDAWTAAWRRQAERFAQAVTSRSAAESSGEQGRNVQALIDAMYRSAASAREVEVTAPPPASRT
jgi:predicted dehydrogenase